MNPDNNISETEDLRRKLYAEKCRAEKYKTIASVLGTVIVLGVAEMFGTVGLAWLVLISAIVVIFVRASEDAPPPSAPW